jgi:glycogen synthase
MVAIPEVRGPTVSSPSDPGAPTRGLRILILTAAYLPWMGGIEILISQLVPLLRERGHDAVVITSHIADSPPGIDDVDGVPVLRVATNHAVAQHDPAKILAIQHQIADFTQQFTPDLVHSHDCGALLWLYRRALRRHRHPAVVTLHNVMSEHVEGSLEVLWKLVREADWVTGVSQSVVDDALAMEPEVAGHISLVRNGVQAPARLSRPIAVDGPPRLLCIGRLVEQKGFDRALAAVARLTDRHPEIHLTIAGIGPEQGALVDQAHRLGIADRVEFLGLVEHERIPDLLDDCTMLLMPSRYEGLPLVALEAAWMARPVVGAAAPGLSDAVSSETGVLLDVADTAAFAAAIDKLLTDRTRARALGDRARELVARDWSLAACADAYEALYRRLL